MVGNSEVGKNVRLLRPTHPGLLCPLGTKQSKFLSEKFGSIEYILAEMQTITCIENKGKMKFITSLVEEQVDIYREFGFDFPERCELTYVSKK